MYRNVVRFFPCQRDCLKNSKQGGEVLAEVVSVAPSFFHDVFACASLKACSVISIPTKFLSRLVQACTSKKSPKKPESHKLDQLGHIFSQAYSGNSENLVFKN
jgi:hypothetical protein